MAKSSGADEKAQRKAEKRRRTALARDPHVLYEAAVQSVEADCEFFERVFKRYRGRRPHLLREDFCGTAALAGEWVARHRDNRAWGVDLHGPTLKWSRRNRLPRLGAAAERVTLVKGDVLEVVTPPAEIVAALNFSYWVFKERAALRRYFERARAALKPGGLLILDVFGGTDAMDELEEERSVKKERAYDGTPIPSFTYIWEQASFNPVDHHIVCHIGFRLRDGRTIERAFRYDWRLWTLPELKDLLIEAGFRDADVYVEGWDDELDEADGVYRRRTRFENQAGWVAYVVGLT